MMVDWMSNFDSSNPPRDNLGVFRDFINIYAPMILRRNESISMMVADSLRAILEQMNYRRSYS